MPIISVALCEVLHSAMCTLFQSVNSQSVAFVHCVPFQMLSMIRHIALPDNVSNHPVGDGF